MSLVAFLPETTQPIIQIYEHSLSPGLINNTELRIFSAILMFSVGDEPSQHLHRLKSKSSLRGSACLQSPADLQSLLPCCECDNAGSDGRNSFRKAEMQHNGCITAAPPLVSRSFARSARAPPNAPRRMFSFFPTAPLPPPHSRRRSQIASPQGLCAGGAFLALIVFEGSSLCALPL